MFAVSVPFGVDYVPPSLDVHVDEIFRLYRTKNPAEPVFTYDKYMSNRNQADGDTLLLCERLAADARFEIGTQFTPDTLAGVRVSSGAERFDDGTHERRVASVIARYDSQTEPPPVEEWAPHICEATVVVLFSIAVLCYFHIESALHFMPLAMLMSVALCGVVESVKVHLGKATNVERSACAWAKRVIAKHAAGST